MKEWLQIIGIWISRIAYCRGFGIQSPSAYKFVRYVINEHYPYYAYKELKQKIRVKSRIMLKLMRLYMRIANYVQPEYILDLPDNWSIAREAYFKAGSRRAVYNKLTEDEFSVAETIGRKIVIRTDATQLNTIRLFLNGIDSSSIIIIDGIHHNAQTYRAWKTITNEEATGVSFDLYYTGIIMMDHTKHKRCYQINY